MHFFIQVSSNLIGHSHFTFALEFGKKKKNYKVSNVLNNL